MRTDSVYSEIPTMWVEVDALTRVFLANAYEVGEYKRIGIDFNVRKVNLSHIMYGVVQRKMGRGNVFVDPSSYIEENKLILDAIFDLIFFWKEDGIEDITIYSNVKSIIAFLNWAREEKLLPVHKIENARVIYEQYSVYLRGRMRIVGKGSMGNRTAHLYQLNAKKLLQAIFDDKEDYISSFIHPIPGTSKSSNATVADKEEVEYSFRFYYMFFDQVADHILNGKPYPFKMRLPTEDLWVFPHKTGWICPSHRGAGGRLLAYDYGAGRIRNEDELPRNKRVLETRMGAIEKMKNANKNTEDDIHRLLLAEKALGAYYMVFLSLTGTNDSVLAMTPWDGEYDTEKGMQGFRVIKPRAAYKTVGFELQNEFIESFEKFLKLRKYLLQGNELKYLFFGGHGKGANVTRKQKQGEFGGSIYRTWFSKYDPNLPSVLSRKFRVHKHKWILNKYGVWSASLMSQSSVTTMLSSYHGESEEDKMGQVSSFMRQMHSKITESLDNELVETSVGKCVGLDDPHNEGEKSYFEPDCNRPEGCLFCSQYRIHPDEKDVRKVLSLEYIVTEVLVTGAQNKEHFDRIMGPVLERIRALIGAVEKMSSKNKRMVESVRHEVYEERNLSHYWEMKLTTLYLLGAVR